MEHEELSKLNRYMGWDDAAQFTTPIDGSDNHTPKPHYGSEWDKNAEQLLTDIEDKFLVAWGYMLEYMPYAANRVSGSPDFAMRIQNGRDRFVSKEAPIQDRYLVLRTLLSEMGWALHQFGLHYTDNDLED